MELDELVADIPWTEFEGRNDGTIHIKYEVGKPCLPVHMRVGFYMRRPMQALMAAGKYLRMRPVGELLDQQMLAVLDPEHPESSLYPYQRWELEALSVRPLWRPNVHMQQGQYAQAQQLAQYQLQQAQQLAGLAQAQYVPQVLTSNNTQWPLGGIW